MPTGYTRFECPAPSYVVVWVECFDEEDAEQIEAKALAALEPVAHGRMVMNRIQDDQP